MPKNSQLFERLEELGGEQTRFVTSKPYLDDTFINQSPAKSGSSRSLLAIAQTVGLDALFDSSLQTSSLRPPYGIGHDRPIQDADLELYYEDVEQVMDPG